MLAAQQGIARDDGGLGAVADNRRALALFEGFPAFSGMDWYEMACIRSALSGLAGRKGSGIPAGEAEAEAERAIEHLRKAATSGYRNFKAMKWEFGLDPLRNRPDFQLLMMDLAMPADPFARPR